MVCKNEERCVLERGVPAWKRKKARSWPWSPDIEVICHGNHQTEREGTMTKEDEAAPMERVHLQALDEHTNEPCAVNSPALGKPKTSQSIKLSGLLKSNGL